MPERPPSAYFEKMRPRLRKQYPSYGPDRIDQIAAGIYHGMSDTAKQRVTSQLEGKAANTNFQFSDDDDFWDSIVTPTSEQETDSGKPTLGDIEYPSRKNPNPMADPATAIAAINAISQAYGDANDDLKKEEEKQRKQEMEAPIHDAMGLETRAIFTSDDTNPAQEQMRNEYEWGKDIREGKEDDIYHKKPVIAGVTNLRPVFHPPLTDRKTVQQAIDFFSDPNNEKQYTPQARKAIWAAISYAAKNISSQWKPPVLQVKRIMYDLEPIAMSERMYSISMPFARVEIKSAVACKDPETCENPAHDHQYFVEGFVTTPMKDLQGEIVADSVYPVIAKEMTNPPHDLGWLDHESPYAKPEENQATPPILRFVEASVRKNPIGKIGLWSKAMLNKAHPEFKRIWSELKNGFYNAFSMEFMPLHEAKQWIGKELTNVVDNVKYLSTSLVRAPANEGAFIQKVYAKSFSGVGWSESRPATAGHDNKEMKGENMKMSQKDLGRETGTTAPERSNTAIGEWGDPTMEKGQAQLHDAQERLSSLNKLKPSDTPWSPRQRRAPGAQGKAVPPQKPTTTYPSPDEAKKLPPRPSVPSENPEDYQGNVEKEEEESGYSYQPSEDAPNVETDATKMEEEERRKEEEEERCMEEAYKSFLKKHGKGRDTTEAKALDWLTRKFPDMPLATARKAAGEMTEIMGEVNAPQKISKEQKPPEVDYGRYGSPDVVPPLTTFSATMQQVATKAVADQLDSIVGIVEQAVRRNTRDSVVRKGYGAENTVRPVSGAETQPDDTVEEQLQKILGGF